MGQHLQGPFENGSEYQQVQGGTLPNRKILDRPRPGKKTRPRTGPGRIRAREGKFLVHPDSASSVKQARRGSLSVFAERREKLSRRGSSDEIFGAWGPALPKPLLKIQIPQPFPIFLVFNHRFDQA